MAAGDSFTIQNAAGENVYTGTAVCAARYLFYSSVDLTDGESYAIGSVSSTAQTGTTTTGMAGGMGGPGGGDFDPENAPDGGQRPDGDDDRTPPQMGEGGEPPERSGEK